MSSIAFVLPNISNGGAEKSTLTLINMFLTDPSVNISLFLLKKPKSELPSYLKSITYQSPFTSPLLSLFWLIYNFLQIRPTHTYSAIRHINLVNIVACRLSSIFFFPINCIISEHSPPLVAKHGPTYFSHITVRLLMKLIYSFADCVVGVCPSVTDQLREFIVCPPKNIQTIPNFIDSNKLSLLSNKTYDPLSSKKYFCVVARLVPEKNVSMIISAFNIFLEDHKDFHLVIVGHGQQLSHLQLLVQELSISDHVTFTGFLDNPFPIIRRAQALLSFSNYEGFGMTILESVSLGTPYIALDCPVGPSFLHHKLDYGFLIPLSSSTVFDLAIYLSRFSDNQHHFVSQKQIKRTLCAKYFDVQYNYPKIKKLMNL